MYKEPKGKLTESPGLYVRMQYSLPAMQHTCYDVVQTKDHWTLLPPTTEAGSWVMRSLPIIAPVWSSRHWLQPRSPPVVNKHTALGGSFPDSGCHCPR